MSYIDREFETAASHTPGPWDIAPVSSNRFDIGPGIGQVYGTGRTPEANARLIAAAPDMLGELRHIVDNAWQYDDDAREPDGPWTISNETYRRIASLVAKATQP